MTQLFIFFTKISQAYIQKTHWYTQNHDAHISVILQSFYRIVVVGVLYHICTIIFGPYVSRTVSSNDLELTYSELPD